MGDPLGLKAYLAMGKLVALLILIGVVCYQSSQIHKWHTQADKQAAAREADRVAFALTQKQADQNFKVKVQHIEAQHEQVTDRIKSDYGRDLARLRGQPKANPGNAGGSKATGVPEAPGGADGENVCVPRSLLLRAQEIELGRNYLIDWVNEQLKVAR